MKRRPALVTSPAQASAPEPRVLPADLLTVAQVRDRLGLPSIWSVYRHIQHNNLPIRRLGRSIRVCPVELEAWTRRNREAPARDLQLVSSK